MTIRYLLCLLLPLSSWAAYDWKCNLHCFNGGECRHGKGKFGSYAGVNQTKKEELPWESTTTAGTGMYCGCPKGFIGLQCEIAMKLCENDEHMCFNGSPCIKETAMDGKSWWHCECDIAASVMTAKYAENHCKKISTVFCNRKSGDFGYEQMSMCRNGGKCKDKDHDGQKHVGCICLDGFEGERCETPTFKKPLTLSEVKAKTTDNLSKGTIAGIVLIVLGVCACALGALVYRDRKEKKKLRRQKRLENAGILTVPPTGASSKFPSFRVRPDAEVI